MQRKLIYSAAELEALVMEIGFLPFMKCVIPGFSLEECTPSGYWFVKDVKGPWEWREAVAEGGVIAYGKLFCRKAGFISPAFYPYFANYRRNGMDFDTRYQEGLCSRHQKVIVDLLTQRGPMLTHELHMHAGIEKGFDTALSALQMQTDITVRRLEYKHDQNGLSYGWGQARYALSEAVFGEALVCSRYDEEPSASYRYLANHLSVLFPSASEKQIFSVLK